MDKNEKLDIVVMTRNRLHYLIKTLESIKNQSNKNFKLIISDNSDNFLTKNFLQNNLMIDEYHSWHPGISAEEHYQKVKLIGDSKYITIFHDDDLMDEKYVESVLNIFKNYDSVGAVATNAFIIDEKDIIIKQYNFIISGDYKIFNNKENLIKNYLSNKCGGVAPFSSYCYKRENLDKIPFNWKEGNKYFDASFLARFCMSNEIMWLNKNLIKLRHHNERLTTISGVKDYKTLYLAIKGINGICDNLMKEEYRISNLYQNLLIKNKLKGNIYKLLIACFFLFVKSKNFRIRIVKFLINIIKSKVIK